MSKWKLIRQTFGAEEYQFQEGEEVTVGRGVNNKIILTSIVISRNHCVINVQKERVLITDLKSSNGIYVGTKKIKQNTPYMLRDSDVIGFGWTIGAPFTSIKDTEKYIFKLVRDGQLPSLTNRIRFQSDNECEFDDIETKIEALTKGSVAPSPIIETKPLLKRKLIEIENPKIKSEFPQIKNKCPIVTIDDDIIDISDSDTEYKKRVKRENNEKELNKLVEMENNIKTEKEDIEFEAFKVKQEYLGYDEPIEIDSDDDSDDDHWKLRLSPGKTLKKRDFNPEESSYSQLDDLFNEDNEELAGDIISFPPPPDDGNQGVEKNIAESSVTSDIKGSGEMQVNDDDDDDLYGDMISIAPNNDMLEALRNKKVVEPEATVAPKEDILTEEKGKDMVDGTSSDYFSKEKTSLEALEAQKDKVKKALMIEPLLRSPKKKERISHFETKHKSSSTSSKHTRDKKRSSSKRNISDSQKEERKKKLKDIATKDAHKNDQKSEKNANAKQVVNAKVTSSNRGAFLTDIAQNVVKPTKRKDSPRKPSKVKEELKEPSVTNGTETKQTEQVDDIENKKQHTEKSKKNEHTSTKPKDKPRQTTDKSINKSSKDNRIPLKILKPLSESEERPVSKVEPFSNKKPKKSVRFSDGPPLVREFEIEEGNRMKKTSLVKTTLVDKRNTPVLSLEKDTLMKILRWNPQWLEEQINNNEPPPILGHNKPPMTVLHSFTNHSQYVQVIGDLLLMEIWECLTQGYMKTRNQNNVDMKIESMPAPSQERVYELFNLSVKVSVPNNEISIVPRMGEVMILTFGPDKVRRFFFVHNVRSLPRQNNSHSIFSVSLHACYTDKMSPLRINDVMYGKSLAYINNELTLFNAMEYLAGSPLSEAILRPEPRHFIQPEEDLAYTNSQWTKTLNTSQKIAITASVTAALGDRPSIQMVQGPPGTGKSSVICAIVMSYFYDSFGKKQNNRGKILICATSNAAVDELVIRLLNIRQNLPKAERFRMVRVGRVEAMNPRARDVSSQQLAQRDTARLQAEPLNHELSSEISFLEAKINMWKTQAQNTQDPTRVAYCQNRVKQLVDRITMMRSSGGGGFGATSGEERNQQIAHAERRIIEGADIVVTTLSSAHNHKMRVLKRRIALCIIDEAGQAIEPEALIPLTLDVTKLTLIGDPQQLPGFICSQRAKKHGLGESLFYRLAMCSEAWCMGPVLLSQQYRMHPQIADYPNRAFYAGRVLSSPPPRAALPFPPYGILSIASGDKGQGACGGNEMEAWGVARLVVALSTIVRKLNLSLAVITPYNAHKELIKKYLKTLMGQNESHVEVNTVDSFQGQERDVVVVSLARSHGVGFLVDAGRMNVMLTRARYALLVCLNPFAMLRNPLWRTLVEDAQNRDMYRSLPTKVCQPASIQISNEEILQYIIDQQKQ